MSFGGNMSKEAEVIQATAEAVKNVAGTFKGVKVLRWLAGRGLCPLSLYRWSLERQITVDEVSRELEQKVLELRTERQRLGMRA